MKTFLKIRKILLVAIALILATNVINAQDRRSVHMGQRLPQMTTIDRAEIGAEANSDQARGQLIFNTDSNALQYWDGTVWVSLISPDSIFKHIVNNFSDELGDTIISHIINNFSKELGDTIISHIINNFSKELGDTIISHIAKNFTDELGDTILNYITHNVTQDLTDSIMAKVTIDGKYGIKVEGSGTSNIEISLPKGESDGQLLVWKGEEWVQEDLTTRVKQLSITITDGKFTTENLIFYGKTSGITGSLRVVSIEPVFSNIINRRQFLRVDASYQVDSVDNAVEWTVSIENRNFSPGNENELQRVIISYISSDPAGLAEGTRGSLQLAGY
jgi:hypothetical protein